MSLVAILTTAVLSLAAVPKPPAIDSKDSSSGNAGSAAPGLVGEDLTAGKDRHSTPPGIASFPTPGGADVQAGRALPVSSGPSRGLASWYPMRPATCDGVPVPSWVKAWTASLTLPCGSLVRLSGPGGTITVPVEDRGPKSWTGRLFDLSPAAFRAVAGNLWSGVVPVLWGLAS